MSGLNLDFLSNLEVTTADEFAAKKKVTGISQIPLEGDFRVMRNGSVIFSEAFRAQVDNNWLDIVFSKEWLQYPPNQPAVAFISITAEDNRAKADIKQEGKIAYIKERFLALSTELWGIDWENLSFVDFKLESPEVIVPVCLVPKVVQRGEKKGEPDYAKRENAKLIPIVPIISEVDAEPAQAPVAEDNTALPEDGTSDETIPDFSEHPEA